MKTLFIFRRDLRIYDNTSLNMVKNKYPKSEILPIFIFNKKQIDENVNKYYSKNAAQFLFESLEELDFMNYYYTDNEISILDELYKKFKFDVISYNKDYTPYAKKRDNEINLWAINKKIEIITSEDYTLHNMGEITKDNKEPYLKFTPFYKKSILKKPRSLITNKNFNFIKDDKSLLLTSLNSIRPKPNKFILVNGGRKNALVILEKLKSGKFDNYDNERDYPFLDKTTKLSAYIKFGCISIREIYYTLPITHGIIRELYWHDFYAIITNYFPYVLNGQSFIKKYENIKWNTNNDLLEKWKNGLTGFPLIDAAMRQLKICGWMHNRCRMVVASFLVKNLLIDWRKGEQHFAKSLVDYDPSSNNGGWQWCASTGTDSQPYFRIFSPTLQMKKFDNNCDYIKKWIPELKDISNKIILNWELKQYPNINYPKPIINIKETSKIFIKTFKEI
uniref:Photolyase/cryptochrome alpha/beta domain-containing protein n=1 Tax=viral metagenome TaxID=1070528 RepID=A0A6C0EP91_9ZZZZ